MSRKQFTNLLVEVKVPQAPGKTQKETLAWILGAMKQAGSPFQSFHNQVQVKLTGTETKYL
ncbi:MAG: hypothetical protein JZU60_02600 [Ilumatobacteraceae bacterium]|nr:hypothetical protein [Ilumatobacteraceae bacterium]